MSGTVFNRAAALVLATALLAGAGPALAGSYEILHAFALSDGAYPAAGVIADKAGNLYGTTAGGGSNSVPGSRKDCDNAGCGTVFELASGGTLFSLHDFDGQKIRNGVQPYGGLTLHKAGTFYGTTIYGARAPRGSYGCGTVFKLDGAETILHRFTCGSDGEAPSAGLVMDKAGNLYGTTELGGGVSGAAGYGTVFKITPNGAESILYAFAGGTDGAYPAYGALISDASGNLYGTTEGGGGSGCNGSGCGTVFKVAPDGTETVLHAFAAGTDGDEPSGGLVADKAGNLYGTTASGGGGNCNFETSQIGCGIVFEIAPNGTETVLHAFAGTKDGAFPFSGLVRDKAGNLFGTTTQGGGGTGCASNYNYDGCGVVFELAVGGSLTVLHAFSGASDGAFPMAELLMDKAGNVYGTTYIGGSTGCSGNGCGTVFKVVP